MSHFRWYKGSKTLEVNTGLQRECKCIINSEYLVYSMLILVLQVVHAVLPPLVLTGVCPSMDVSTSVWSERTKRRRVRWLKQSFLVIVLDKHCTSLQQWSMTDVCVNKPCLKGPMMNSFILTRSREKLPSGLQQFTNGGGPLISFCKHLKLRNQSGRIESLVYE